ncbi:hypothetical protein QT711_13415 [Sporosarcina saromensis]|uniref:Uncharacterized protein n=1 Tax=Sporosarcina saromensis TaxID=359365 RepID=A0ABU4GB30_9BACL|nr:hypothetical protein [Sporosarcina saromensis]MDW0114189.1 hypothetical protein [Sporosarcina saromensis]
MDKQDRRDEEIEQLNKKIERYRQALASLKKDSSTTDIHLKRRMGKVEKSVEAQNGQLEEMAKMLEEGLRFLSKQVTTIEETVKELTTQVADLEESSSSGDINVDHIAASKSSVPSFRQLHHMANQLPMEMAQKQLHNRYNYPPPTHVTAASIKATHTQDGEEHEDKRQIDRWRNHEGATQEVVRKTATPVQDAPSSTPSAKVIPEVTIEQEERNTNSPLWNVFKRK